MRWETTYLTFAGSAALRAIAAITLLLIVVSMILPTPHLEARLFSDGWGASSFMDPNFCMAQIEGQPPRMALFAKVPAVAQWSDRLGLLVEYLLWGLWLPILALITLRKVYVGRPLHQPAALVLIFGLLGLVPASFQWTLNPAFVGLRQVLAEWLLAHISVTESQFVWIDAAALIVWLGGGLLLVGGAVFAAVWSAARLANINWLILASGLVPFAGGLLFLSLTMDGALYLRGEGVNLDWLPGLRAAVLMLAAGTSAWRGVQLIKVGAGGTAICKSARTAASMGTATKLLASCLWLLPLLCLAANAALLYFRWTGRFHV